MPDPELKPYRAMVIAPFDPSGDKLRDEISKVLRELGIDVFRADTLKLGSQLTYEIINAIESADLIVADVSQANPNVFYELGFAHALRKPTFLMTSRDGYKGVPADLLNYQHFVYDPANLSDFRNQLKRMISRLVAA